MKKRVEILSPAGSYECLQAAIVAGADAVYVGGTRFGARAYANNFTEEELLQAIDYVHLHGRKIYLTINTLFKEQELNNELYHYLLPYYKQGLDAVIVQDVGVLTYIKEQFPDLPIHASTQMTVTNLLGAKFLSSMGVERIVTAREMQLAEIEEITKNTDIEIESFVHGALCYCYSGQCLYSSLIGGRSGNRGQCAQPCRLPYRVNNDKENRYILSLKDICTLEYIPALVESGIYSFKIEGRMKKPEYVALVTAMYRKYVDLYLKHGKEAFHVEPKDREMLMDLYNRGGSHGGYYYTKNGKEMLSIDRPNHAGVPALKVLQQSGRNITAKALVDIHKGDIIELPTDMENYTFPCNVSKGKQLTLTSHKKQTIAKNDILNRTRNESLIEDIRTSIIARRIKETIKGKLTISTKEPSKITLFYKDLCVEVTGDTAQAAINQPMAVERIEKQLRKTGNTEFEFEELQIELDGQLFIPMQALNELRRTALEQLEKQILGRYRRATREPVIRKTSASTSKASIPLYVYVENLMQWEEAMRHDRVRRIYFDCNAMTKIWENKEIYEIIDLTHRKKKEIYLAMPHVFRSNSIRKYETNEASILTAQWDGVLIRNFESYMFLRDHGYKKNIVTDFHLYQFNSCAKQFWKNEKIESTTAPLELNFRELSDVGLEESELVVYGYAPMMVTAQCIAKSTKGCTKEKEQQVLHDRYGKKFTVKNYCDYCYNIIYNTTPIVLTDQKNEILELHPKAIRLHFTIEKQEDMRKVLALYDEVFNQGIDATEPDFEFTRGHFKRGIK